MSEIVSHKQKNSAWNAFSDYSQRSTIHGVQYLGENKRHWSERLMWLIAFTISIYWCGKVIFEMNWRRMYQPVLISFAEETTKVSDIPFPTVTICLDGPQIDENILNYTNIFESDFNEIDFSDEMALQVKAVSDLMHCDEPKWLSGFLQSKNIKIDQTQFARAETVVQDLFSDAYCFLDNIFGFSCSVYFERTITLFGFCYTFNYLESSEKFSDKMADDYRLLEPFHIEDYSRNITYPYHVRSAKENFDLNIPIHKNQTETKNCPNKFQGLKIFIHPGDEMIEQNINKYYYVPLNHDARLTIRPNIVKTDQSLIENYDKNQRKCIAENDLKLKFFKKYTQSNCQLDASIDVVSEKLGCADFWMPRFAETKVCNLTFVPDFFPGTERLVRAHKLTDKCLPACNSITYDVQLTTNLMDETEKTADNEINIHISFSDEQYFTLQRSELYGTNDFISGCGGVLGLFMGISVLSIIEILYSFTLRAFCNRRDRNVPNNELASDEQFKREENVNQATEVMQMLSGSTQHPPCMLPNQQSTSPQHLQPPQQRPIQQQQPIDAMQNVLQTGQKLHQNRDDILERLEA